MSLTAGTKIAQYEIVQPLGSGGMGEVYRARDVRLGREVAVKVMAAHIAADPEMRRRFETEARAVAALSHPSILSMYELAVTEGVPFAVMELLEGENLRQRLKGGAILWREAAEIAAAVADGLAVAHAKGIIHRDLKPENVFLTSEGHVKILDFGLALHRMEAAAGAEGPTVAHTAHGIVMGTFGYMAPEQVTGERVDGRTDIFTLGCLLFEMLTGRQLFTGQTPQEVIAKLLHDTIPELSAFDAAGPRELRAIVARCIERNPARRFESAQDVSMALRALLTGSTSTKMPRQGRARAKSLAVLPFVNASGDPQLEYLADGITESVINSLSQLGTLRVVPRSLVFRYKGLQSDPATVGLALNARTILTGRVARIGEQLNIQAELVDTVAESQLWGDQFRQNISDLLTVQEEIAWQISEALRLKLTVEQKRKLRKRHTVNPEALQEYLRGRHHFNTWRHEAFRTALAHFERAIQLDPTYALAYSGLGDTYGAMAYYGHIAPEDGFPRARAAALRALELDPEVADAHVTLGLERLFWAWDWNSAERELQHAIALNPKLSFAHSMYALVLVSCGRYEQALAEARLGRDLDPLSPFAGMGVAWVHHFSGNHAEALREAQRARDVVPGLEEAGNVIITSYEALGRYEEAARLMSEQRCWGLTMDGARLLDAYRSGGAQEYWAERLRMMNAGVSLAPSAVQFAYALVHLQVGQVADALDCLERMIENHVGGCVFIACDPCLRTLRGHERYELIVRRVGTPMASARSTVSS
jgi:serine/threonine protein kinase/Flp pilus assembly protein TadD